MPELPDVEVFKRYLDATALNQKIARVSVQNTTVLRHIAPQTLARNLKGRMLRSSRRHGKFLFGQLDQDGSVIFHFGMTGFLKYFKDKAQEPKHIRVRMDFSNGSFLGFVCPRMFGEVDHTSDVNRYIEERGLGPDALAVSWQEFKVRLWGAKSSIKSALMDQKLLAGIGNVYSDEILFQARVHPQDRVDRLGQRTLNKVYRMMRSVLKKTIRYHADPDLHIIKPEYDPSWRMISEYEIGRFGWAMQLAFFSLSVASVGAIVAVWSDVKSIIGYIGLVFLLIAATGMIIGGIFPSDPITTDPDALSASGKMHILGATLGIPAMPFAVVFISWVVTRRSTAWASARRWLWLTTALVWLSFVALVFLAFVIAKGTLGPDVLIGWPNRLFIIGYSLWLMVVAWHAIQLSRQTA
jgi:formamidopyrimidine-DNA glycosylase